jgi:hypothetical protein
MFSLQNSKICRNYKTWTVHTCLWGSSILQPSWLINLVSTSLYIFESPRNSYTCSSFMHSIVFPNASSMQHLQESIFRILISLSHYTQHVLRYSFNKPLNRMSTRLTLFIESLHRACTRIWTLLVSHHTEHIPLPWKMEMMALEAVTSKGYNYQHWCKEHWSRTQRMDCWFVTYVAVSLSLGDGG